ncbi:MAG: FmdB family zinc ribbon protein [Anaerolineales bacterium]
MPLYEYTCTSCNSTFDQLRPMAQADETIDCPSCGSGETARALSAIATPNIGNDSPDLSASPSPCACGGACACGGH